MGKLKVGLKVGILGVGSIGEFHAREFKKNGCDVVAILTSSFEGATNKAEKLNQIYGINARPYSDFDEFLREELDIVSVCTPIGTHYKYVESLCLMGLFGGLIETFINKV